MDASPKSELVEEEAIESSRGKGSKFSCESTGSGMVARSAEGSLGASSSPSKSSSNSGNKANAADNKDDNNRGGRSRSRIPENFCRDYIFFTCSRKDCKYKHPSPDSQEYKEAIASRPGWTSRDRSRSPHNNRNNNHNSSGDSGGGGGVGGGTKDKPTVCRDFLRNNCFRGKDCRFHHPNEGEDEELPWPQLCLDYRAGNCERFDCRLVNLANTDMSLKVSLQQLLHLFTKLLSLQMFLYFLIFTCSNFNLCVWAD